MDISTFGLHDVGFVNGCDLLPSVANCIVKGKLRYPVGFLVRDDFQALHNTRNTLGREGKVQSQHLCV